MKILGIHVRSHDTSVALIENGKIIYAAANERFSRIKMDRNPPIQALKNLLEYTKTKPEEIDIITFVEDPFPKALWLNLMENCWPVISTKGKYLIWLKKPSLIFAEIFISSGLPSYIYRFLLSKYKIMKLLKGFKGKIKYDHHHFAHLHSAYYASGWDECLVMANEGSGFTETLSIYHVKDGKWNKIVENKLPNSVGKFYELVTELLGFDRHRHPGKITGLSAYGDYRQAYPFVKRLLSLKKDKVILNHRMYLKLLAFYLLNNKLPDELIKLKREDIAAAFQKRLEECLVGLVSEAIKKTKVSNIALAGGVAANVKANQKIHEIPGVEGIYVHQAMGDDGLALGAAMYYSAKNGEPVKQPENVYFGPDFSDEKIEVILKKNKLIYKRSKNIEANIAKSIADGKVVARFNGRMEYGPRALGNRSILYHARDKTVNEWLNKRLKRTEFMPFAPVVLDTFAKKCFLNLKGAEYSAKFMTITFNCSSYIKNNSPAVVHVDGTARPQILLKKDNPSYYKILSEYYKLTGIPVLVNTSFNMHEEPIVCTPEDAVRAFLSSGIDFLAIGSFILSYEDNKNISVKFGKGESEKKKKKSLFKEFLNH